MTSEPVDFLPEHTPRPLTLAKAEGLRPRSLFLGKANLAVLFPQVASGYPDLVAPAGAGDEVMLALPSGPGLGITLNPTVTDSPETVRRVTAI